MGKKQVLPKSKIKAPKMRKPLIVLEIGHRDVRLSSFRLMKDSGLDINTFPREIQAYYKALTKKYDEYKNIISTQRSKANLPRIVKMERELLDKDEKLTTQLRSYIWNNLEMIINIGRLPVENYFRIIGRMHKDQNNHEIRYGFIMAFTSQKEKDLKKLGVDLFELIKNNNFSNVFLFNNGVTATDLDYMLRKPKSLIVIDASKINLDKKPSEQQRQMRGSLQAICTVNRTKRLSIVFVGKKKLPPYILENADIII